MVGRIYHVGLTVSNLDKSIAFYVTYVLGLDICHRRNNDGGEVTLIKCSKEEL